jgi:hypothetical protein
MASSTFFYCNVWQHFFSTLKSDERQNECTAAAFLIMTTGIASPLLNVKHFLLE